MVVLQRCTLGHGCAMYMLYGGAADVHLCYLPFLHALSRAGYGAYTWPPISTPVTRTQTALTTQTAQTAQSPSPNLYLKVAHVVCVFACVRMCACVSTCAHGCIWCRSDCRSFWLWENSVLYNDEHAGTHDLRASPRSADATTLRAIPALCCVA